MGINFGNPFSFSKCGCECEQRVQFPTCRLRTIDDDSRLVFHFVEGYVVEISFDVPLKHFSQGREFPEANILSNRLQLSQLDITTATVNKITALGLLKKVEVTFERISDPA